MKNSTQPNAYNTTPDVTVYKEFISANRKKYNELFDPAKSVRELIHSKSRFIDHTLTTIWTHFFQQLAEKLCLLAVGGYGRRELFPNSDIDILILVEGNEQDHHEALSGFANFLWDIGLKPGLSVRTLEQCHETAKQDQTIFTSLIESHYICGKRELHFQLQKVIESQDLWPSEHFFSAKLEEQQKRYLKFNETAYNLEPNIKEGPGGLRDMQNIAWVFKRHYHSDTLKELIKYDFLPEEEYEELTDARETVWRIRYALHLLTNRSEDRLLFDFQRELAEQFGFTDKDACNNVERFMQYYFKTVVGLERLNEMLLQLFSERFVLKEKTHNSYAINFNFKAVNGYIEASHDDVFKQTPIALLEIFLLQQQISSIKGVRATTIRLIRKHLHLIDDEFRNNSDAQHLFIEIFRQPHGLTRVLRQMNRYGVLAAYLPAFANIVARMQYDLFHVYTVDVHTLFAIRNLRRFSLEKHYHELPFCNDIFRLIRKPDILYLAALLHDIAKGLGGDHSILGAEIAAAFCKQHKLSDHDSKLISWLVKNHLNMSMTAQRKDIRDPEVIHEFAKMVGNTTHLNYLYLLTVADIRATNPQQWNSWKDTLLKDLYISTHQTLLRGLDHPIEIEEKLQENKHEAQKDLIKLGLPEKTIRQTWQLLSDSYFLRYSVDEIVWHTISIAKSSDKELPLVLFRPQTISGSAEVFVYTYNQDNIFSKCTATLDHLGLTILDARIITTKTNFVLNSFQILEQSGSPIKDLYREIRICNTLRNSLCNKKTTRINNQHKTSRQAQHFPIKTRISFHQDPHNQQTVLELITTDSAGLLSKIGKIFQKQHIALFNAKITTIGSRVEDMFYISSKPENSPLNEQQQQKLSSLLSSELNN